MPRKKFLTDIKTIRARARKHIEQGAVTEGYPAARKTIIRILNEALVRSRGFRHLARVNRPESLDGLAALACPVRILWGDADGVLPVTHAAEFTKRIGRATLEILGASPHMAGIVLAAGVTRIGSLGRPFRTGAYPGVYVPYVIEIGHGDRMTERRYNLALRDDNAQRRWVFDGGF